MAQQPVQTVNGKIVYNRKYGDIPKGSYTGGSTYTVKRGDTLFYIAWVTGNDFRDLAQRNNIPAPYGLNVGQTLQVGNSAGQPITGDNAVAAASVRASGGATAASNAAQNRPQWLRHNQLLRILNPQVNRMLIRCCRTISQRRRLPSRQ